jgi:hypothetical protein
MTTMAEKPRAIKVKAETVPALAVSEFVGKGDARCLCSVGARVCLAGCFSLNCTGSNVVESYISTGYRSLANAGDYQLNSSRDVSTTVEGAEKGGLGRGACLCSPSSLEVCLSACSSISCFGADVVKQYIKEVQ